MAEDIREPDRDGGTCDGRVDRKARDRIPKSQFAYVDKEGEGHLPIHDDSHVRNAIARFDQTEFESVAAKDRARRKILAAARKGHRGR